MRCKLAAGDPEVVGVLLGVELVHAQVPDTEVSIRRTCSKQLTTGAKGTRYHSGVGNGTGPERRNRNQERRQEHSIKAIREMQLLVKCRRLVCYVTSQFMIQDEYREVQVWIHVL